MLKMPIDRLRELFSYDAETGILLRLIGRRAGRAAGKDKRDGYRYVYVNETCYLEHRICWALHYGTWPEGPLDHINMVRSDNRIANLRGATIAENNRNKGPQRNNLLGIKGVSLHKPSGNFSAKIMRDKKTIYLGHHKTKEEAAEAYRLAAIKHHGNYARS